LLAHWLSSLLRSRAPCGATNRTLRIRTVVRVFLPDVAAVGFEAADDSDFVPQ